MTTRASKLKSLKDNLQPCSKDLQKQVLKRGLLSGKPKILDPAALRKLADAAGVTVPEDGGTTSASTSHE
jgi:hypothetical protein